VTVQPLAWVMTAAAQFLLQGIARLRGQVMRDIELAQGGNVVIAERGHRGRGLSVSMITDKVRAAGRQRKRTVFAHWTIRRLVNSQSDSRIAAKPQRVWTGQA
jgi:hypothetical protein